MNSKITPGNWAITIGLLVLLGAAAVAVIMKFSSEKPAVPVASSHGFDFTLPDLKGSFVNLREYAGGRPVVVSFGTTSCPYCVLQLKTFKALRNDYGDKVALLEVNVGEPPERVAAHVAKLDSPIRTLIDRKGEVFMRYGSDAVPVTVVADASGRILKIGNYMPLEQLTALLGLQATSRPAAQSAGL